jgi:hypothetical protein
LDSIQLGFVCAGHKPVSASRHNVSVQSATASYAVLRIRRKDSNLDIVGIDYHRAVSVGYNVKRSIGGKVSSSCHTCARSQYPCCRDCMSRQTVQLGFVRAGHKPVSASRHNVSVQSATASYAVLRIRRKDSNLDIVRIDND